MRNRLVKLSPSARQEKPLWSASLEGASLQLPMTAAERFASWTARLSLAAIPPEVDTAAKLHLLDVIGCGLAAHALGIATAARETAGESGGRGEASVIGLREPLPRAAAAFANGMLCHGLDYDDTHTDAVCHVSAVMGPAS